MKEERKIAYIFKDVGGWYVCDNDTPYLDTRGRRYDSKAHAFYAARFDYTHYLETTTKRIRKFGPSSADQWI